METRRQRSARFGRGADRTGRTEITRHLVRSQKDIGHLPATRALPAPEDTARSDRTPFLSGQASGALPPVNPARSPHSPCRISPTHEVTSPVNETDQLPIVVPPLTCLPAVDPEGMSCPGRHG